MMFPLESLQHIVTLTNVPLAARGCNEIDMGEFLCWFGAVLLVSHCEFASRRELWLATSLSQFLPPIELGGTTGITHDQCNETWN